MTWHSLTTSLPLQEATALVHEIKDHGNEALKRGNSYNALWKYYHALLISQTCPLHPNLVAVINGNCAQACLNMKLYIQAITYASIHAQLDPQSPKV